MEESRIDLEHGDGDESGGVLDKEYAVLSTLRDRGGDSPAYQPLDIASEPAALVAAEATQC